MYNYTGKKIEEENTLFSKWLKEDIMSEWLVKFCKHVNNTKIVCDSKKVKQIYHYTSPEAAKSILTNVQQKGSDSLTKFFR